MTLAQAASLTDLFADECGIHLAAIAASRAVLADRAAGPARHDEAAQSIGASLHTLAGAARAVELLDLEYLCRALEGLAGAGWNQARLALLDEALLLAPRLLDAASGPAPRLRNQAMALVTRCEGLRA